MMAKKANVFQESRNLQLVSKIGSCNTLQHTATHCNSFDDARQSRSLQQIRYMDIIDTYIYAHIIHAHIYRHTHTHTHTHIHIQMEIHSCLMEKGTHSDDARRSKSLQHKRWHILHETQFESAFSCHGYTHSAELLHSDMTHSIVCHDSFIFG